MNTRTPMWFWAILAAIILAIVGLVVWNRTRPSPLDAFASCLGQRGATFYGAYWCPHCQAEKALFGRSERLLPYVECAAPNNQGQTRICIEKKIDVYPTWVFADGSRETGEQSLAHLAEKTGCAL